METSQYDETEDLYKEYLDIRKRVRGVNHPDTIITMTNLANVYEYHKKIDQVEILIL